MRTYVHGQAWPYKPDAHSKTRASGQYFYSLWSRRLVPYERLDRGDRVIVVDSGAGKRIVGWEYRVIRAASLNYDSLHQAARQIALALKARGVTTKERHSNPYWGGKKAQGYGIAWYGTPVRYFGYELPAEVKMSRSGWQELTPQELRAWGMSDSANQNGRVQPQATQGIETDPKIRRAVERHAENRALTRYRDWAAERRGKPFDFVLRRRRAVRYLEVKGTTGALGPVAITPNEFKWASSHTVDLVVVHGITAIKTPDGSIRCSGGSVHKVKNWRPDIRNLTVRTYMCPVK